MDAKELVGRLHWLGHDSFRLDGPPVVYFDPWKLRGALPAANLVLVSHDHHDHCSPDDVAALRGPDTVIVCDASAAAKLPGAQVVRPGDALMVAGLEIEAVPAYNTDKFRSPGQPFHPQTAGHVGFVVKVGGIRLYFAGDTDQIPEMAQVRCDVALLPVSGTYVMTVEEAVRAAQVLKPQIVVPMHFGSGIGTPEDGGHFARLFGGEVRVLKQE